MPAAGTHQIGCERRRLKDKHDGYKVLCRVDTGRVRGDPRSTGRSSAVARACRICAGRFSAKYPGRCTRQPTSQRPGLLRFAAAWPNAAAAGWFSSLQSRDTGRFVLGALGEAIRQVSARSLSQCCGFGSMIEHELGGVYESLYNVFIGLESSGRGGYEF